MLTSNELGIQPGTKNRENVGGLHRLRMIEPLKNGNILAEGFDLLALAQERPGDVHQNVSPTLAVLDLVGGPREA